MKNQTPEIQVSRVPTRYASRFHAPTIPDPLSGPVKPGKAKNFYFSVQLLEDSRARFNNQGHFFSLIMNPAPDHVCWSRDYEKERIPLNAKTSSPNSMLQDKVKLG